MSDHRQRQRHGATKNLAEGIGGAIVGSALVLLLRQLLRSRGQKSEPKSGHHDEPLSSPPAEQGPA